MKNLNGKKVQFFDMFYTYSSDLNEFGEPEIVDESFSRYGVILSSYKDELLILWFHKLRERETNEIIIDELNCSWHKKNDKIIIEN